MGSDNSLHLLLEKIAQRMVLLVECEDSCIGNFGILVDLHLLLSLLQQECLVC